jgi:hypothetical protein
MSKHHVQPEDKLVEQIPVSKRTKKRIALYKVNNDFKTYDAVINELFKGIELPGENHGT